MYGFQGVVESSVVTGLGAMRSSFCKVDPPFILKISKLALKSSACKAEGCLLLWAGSLSQADLFSASILWISSLFSSNQSLLFFAENPRVSSDACRIGVLMWSHSRSVGEFDG